MTNAGGESPLQRSNHANPHLLQGGPSPSPKRNVEEDSEGAVYEDERATFVDATYEDAEWVARRLSPSPSAQTVLSPLHPNTIRSGAKISSVPPRSRASSVPVQQHGVAPPPALPPGGGRSPSSRDDSGGQPSSVATALSPPRTRCTVEDLPVESVHLSPPRPGQRLVALAAVPEAVSSPATPPAAYSSGRVERRAGTPFAVAPERMNASDDAEMAVMRSEALTRAAALLPASVGRTVLRLDRENSVLRAVAKERKDAASELERQLQDERSKSQEYIQKAVALSARLEESKQHVRRLKRLVAEVRQTNLPVHNELHQARVAELERRKEEERRRLEEEARVARLVRQQQEAEEEISTLAERLRAVDCTRCGLERLVDDLCTQHTADLRRVIEAGGRHKGAPAEAAALQLHIDGLMLLLRRAYTAGEAARSDEASAEQLMRQVREARDHARRAAEERAREAEAHRVQERRWEEERQRLYSHLRWYDDQHAAHGTRSTSS